MSRSKYLISSWLPVVLIMGLIFGASTDFLSGGRTSRYIGPVLRWIYPGISDHGIKRVQLGVRKTAHVGEYALLAVLLLRAIRRTRGVSSDAWCRRCVGWAFALAVTYAVTDEWHQSFVPSREGTIHDVIIDGCGAGLGLLLMHRRHLWRQARGLRPRD